MKDKSQKVEVKKTVCNMCGASCGLDLHIQEGKIVRVLPMADHLYNQICPKAEALTELVYNQERITSPLRQVNGKWQEISWDEALELICDQLHRIRKQYGPQALVTYSGVVYAGNYLVRGLQRRFCDLYGTPNFTTGASLCFFARIIGHGLTLNTNKGMMLSPDIRNTNLILAWGRNYPESYFIDVEPMKAASNRGVKYISVDPRKTPVSSEADIHAQLRPGTDCALALGLLNVIINEELYDKEFIRQWTSGFEKLAEHVQQYSPEKVEEITWVDRETIKNIARIYATTRPATIYQGISVDHIADGIYTSRALAILVAITGNFDVPGGNLDCPFISGASLNIRDKTDLKESIGAGYPIFSHFLNQSSVMPLTETILSGKPYPIKSLIVQGGNPVLTWPNTSRAKEALSKLELLVVMDLFMTDTAKLAHVFLPAATFTETRHFKSYLSQGFPMLALGEAAIEPLGQCRGDWRLWSDLGRKMGYEEYFPWESPDQVLQYVLEPSGVDMDMVLKDQRGISYAAFEEKGYLRKGFDTPSGKVEIFSQFCEQYGYDPLPTFHEPAESPISCSSLAEQYPLILISGPRNLFYWHSQHRNVPSLFQRLPEPLAQINPQTALSLSIEDEDMVVVETTRGSIEMKAQTTDEMPVGVVNIPHGWSHANANILTDDLLRDPISGYPSFRTLLCRVKKSVT